MSVGVVGAGLMCLVSDPANLPYAIEAFKSGAPVLVPLAKAVVSFPFIFHTLGGVRHLVWDKTARGLDLASVKTSSYAILGLAVAGSLVLATVPVSQDKD